MQLYALALCLASVLPWAAAAPTKAEIPQFFLLQSSVTPGQTGKEAFDKLYLTLGGEDPYLAAFTKLNADALVFNSQPATEAGLYYVGFNDTKTKYDFRAVMEFDSPFGLLWNPVSFPSLGKTTSGSDVPLTNRFIFNSTSSGMELSWSNDIKRDSFVSWYLCEWSLGEVQLFFKVNYHGYIYDTAYPPKFPSTCALATLSVIPVPNAT